MSLKADLLTFLARLPKANEPGSRNALASLTGTEQFVQQIPPNQTNYAFFDQLLRLLIFEGRTTLVNFLRALNNSDFLGVESQQRLNQTIATLQGFTPSQWEEQFHRPAEQKAAIRAPFVLPQLDISTFTGREAELRQLGVRTLMSVT